MNISITDALELFTNEIVSKFSDARQTKSFGRSFFTEVETSSKLASFLSQRSLKLKASDTNRGGRGTLNVFDKSTQNIVYPPYFSEYLNVTSFDSYDALEVDGFKSRVIWGRFMDELGVKMQQLMDKIDAGYEYQCWELLETGIITLNDGASVLSGRKAGSLVDGYNVGGYWTTNGVNPLTGTLARAATWCNETGKMSGNTLDVVFGTDAWNAWLGNSTTNSNDLKFNNNLTSLARTAVRDSTGKTFLGSTTHGAFNYNFFTYSDFYEDESGNKYPFKDTKTVIVMPEMAQNTLTYTAVPQDLTKGFGPRKGKWQTWNEVKRTAIYQGIDSAGIPTLGAIDQVYTEQVVA